jgi:hypothetical protein
MAALVVKEEIGVLLTRLGGEAVFLLVESLARLIGAQEPCWAGCLLSRVCYDEVLEIKCIQDTRLIY